MEIRQFVTDDDAVSPVIGVILMVAITVILAAVIGAFVLGFGAGGPTAPQTSWDSQEFSGSTIEFTLTQTGSELDSSTLRFSGNTTASSTVPPTTVGESVNTTSAGGSVSVVWEDGGSSSTLYTHEV